MIYRESRIRRTAVIRQKLAIGLALLTFGGCANQTAPTGAKQPRAVSIRSVLTEQIRTCTKTIGYNPDTVSVDENKIAPNELKWRQCAYDAVRSYAQSNPKLRQMYESLVAEDIAMTTAIQQGNLTRTERSQRIEALLDQISAAELRESAGHDKHERDVEFTRRMVQDLRGMR